MYKAQIYIYKYIEYGMRINFIGGGTIRKKMFKDSLDVGLGGGMKNRLRNIGLMSEILLLFRYTVSICIYIYQCV